MDSSALIDFSRYITNPQALTEASQSVRSLKKDVTAFGAAVEKDSNRIRQALDKINAAILEIKAKGGALDFVKETDSKALRDLVLALDRVKQAKKELEQADRDRARAQRQATEATTEATNAVKQQQAALKAAAAANDLEGQRKAAAALREIKVQTDQVSKALRGANSELTAARGSYDALVIENNKLLQSLHALEGGLNSGSQEALKLKKQIFDNTETLKNFDLETNRSFRNVGNYAQSFQGLIAELAKARAEQNSFTQGSEKHAAAVLRVSGFQTAAQKSAAQMGFSFEQAEARIEGMTAAIQPLATNLVRLEKEQDAVAKSAGRESEAFRKIGFQVEGAKKQLADATTGTEKAAAVTGSLTQQLGFNKQGLAEFAGGLAVSYIGLQALAGGITAVFQANVKFSSQLADVRKTTGLTADEADRLVASLKELNTPTPLTGLLDIAKVGGQLGIAKTDILDFTKAVDVAVQALGDDFTGGAEQIATELGKIASVFRKELGPDVALNLLNIGSAVNEIGAQGAATAPFLTDVALRVGAVSAQTGVGLKNVFAYAAVLEETGFTSERAGTALNRLFSTLSTKSVESFRIAQKANPALTLKEFTKLVNTDFNAAIQLFLKGLNAGGKTTTELSNLLSTLKLQSGEAKNVIITLAQNTELFAQRQATANQQLSDGTSLATEAAVKYDTLGSSVGRLTNRVSNFFTSGSASRFLQFFVDLKNAELGAVGEILDTLGDKVSRLAQKAGLATKEEQDYTVALVANTKELLKQSGAQQKLLDSYTTLATTKDRSAAQELQLAQLGAQLQAKFGTQQVAAIQARINKTKEEAETNKQGLVDQLAYYDSAVLPGITQRAAQAQEAINKLAQDKGFTAAQLTRLREVAQARLEAEARGSRLTGKSTVNDEQVAAVQKLLLAEQQLTKDQEQRARIAAALGKLQVKATQAQADAADDASDAEEDATAVFNKAAKERAAARQQELENQLANQQRIIDATKKAQAELDRLFEEKAISEEDYTQRVAALNSRETIMTAEQNAATIRINLARAAKDEAVAVASEELNAVKRKRKVTQAEIEDAQQAHFFRLQALALKFKGDRIKVEQDLQDRLSELNKVDPIASKPIGLNPELLKDADKALDLSNERGLRRMEDNAKKEKDRADASNKDIEERLQKSEERKQKIREQAIDLAIQAEQAFFEFQQQRDQEAISNLERDRENQLANAGENADLRLQIEEEYNEKIKAAKRKAAEDDKIAALFQIAIQTALAVAKSIAESPETFGLPFSAFALAAGAIQIAAVAAQPIPQYFKGREGGKAEWAEVGERGPELIAGPKGVRLAQKRGLTFLEAGADVYTADKTREILRASELGNTAPASFSVSMQLAGDQLSGKPTVVDTLPLQEALSQQTNDLIRQLKKMPADSANELVRRRAQMGNQSLGDAIARRLTHG